MASLHKLSEHCNYGETLPEMLRDRLVCGINNFKIQRRLLAEPDLTLKKAEEIALAMELASKQVVDKTTPSKVNQIHSAGKNKGKNQALNDECYRCGEKHEEERRKKRTANTFSRGNSDEDVYVETMYHIVSENKLKPYEVALDLCTEPYRFEIDTGAARSILSEDTYCKL